MDLGKGLGAETMPTRAAIPPQVTSLLFDVLAIDRNFAFQASAAHDLLHAIQVAAVV